MGTKKEAIERKVAWNRALIEGRVVRYNDGLTMTSYSTKEKAEAAARELEGAELVALIGEDLIRCRAFAGLIKEDDESTWPVKA